MSRWVRQNFVGDLPRPNGAIATQLCKAPLGLWCDVEIVSADYDATGWVLLRLFCSEK